MSRAAAIASAANTTKAARPKFHSDDQLARIIRRMPADVA